MSWRALRIPLPLLRFLLGGANPPGEPFYSIVYGFDSLGRFSALTSSVHPRLRATNAWTYSYLAGSDLISGWTEAESGVGISRSYEGNRDLLTQVKNMAGTNLISQFDYQNDALGRRTERIDTRFGRGHGDQFLRVRFSQSVDQSR